MSQIIDGGRKWSQIKDGGNPNPHKGQTVTPNYSSYRFWCPFLSLYLVSENKTQRKFNEFRYFANFCMMLQIYD